jgi:DnaK suppressor protein
MSSRMNAHLSKKQLKLLKEKLVAESTRIKENFEVKKREYLDSKVENKDEVDAANDSIMLATNMRFTNREAKYLKKVIKAIAKFEDDEYGICEECGAQITLKG